MEINKRDYFFTASLTIVTVSLGYMTAMVPILSYINTSLTQFPQLFTITKTRLYDSLTYAGLSLVTSCINVGYISYFRNDKEPDGLSIFLFAIQLGGLIMTTYFLKGVFFGLIFK